MREESSRPGDTTGSTYTDLAAVTPEAYAIASTSRNLARERVGNTTTEDRIRQRCSVAVGDFAMADLMRFAGDPVAAGLAALRQQAPVITDIRMVQAGILKRGHESDILPIIEGAEDLALVPAFQDAGLHHPDIGYDRHPPIECGKPRRDRIAGKPHEIGHRKVADRDRASLPYPVLEGDVSHPLPGKVPTRACYRVGLGGDRRKVSIRTSGGIPGA